MDILKSLFVCKKSFLAIVCLFFAVNLMAQDEEQLFLSFCPETPVVKDHEGNKYRTVQIGSQCWMAENMRCTTSPTGKHWIHDPSFSTSTPIYPAYCAVPTDPYYGVLYNWAAAVDKDDYRQSAKVPHRPLRGICPEGWHLPDNDDWDLLFSTLGGNKQAGELMKMPSLQWMPHLTFARTQLGFDAMPAGAFTENGYSYAGMQTSFWCADNFSNDQAWCSIVYDYKNDCYSYLEYKCYGLSVRCVRDY